MTPIQTEDNPSTSVAISPRKRWMGIALATSLMLHLLAIVFIFAAGSRIQGNAEIIGILLDDVSVAPPNSKNSPAPVLQAPPLPEKTPAPPPIPPAEPPVRKSRQALAPHSGEASAKVTDLMATPLGLGMTYGYVSSMAEGRTLREDIRGYYIELVEKINQEWWRQADGLKEPVRRDGIIELYLQRDGTVISENTYQGTGSREADQLLLEVIKKVSPLPPLPAGYTERVFVAPLRIKAPSHLFRFKDRF